MGNSDDFFEEKLLTKNNESFKGSIRAIYQSFDGEDVYPTLEEKVADLLYFVTRNHSFSDGNGGYHKAVKSENITDADMIFDFKGVNQSFFLRHER